FILVRGSLPRLRYDQLMDLGWKVAFPLAVANIVVTAAIIATGIQGAWLGLGLFAAGVTMILVMDLIAISIKRRVLNHAG
ncbi:NADH-quinone oxidoreductase subunit H, partial [Candidatus Sumerlaeota bacterium]|nr:NADH-quinone oxidoreductase subunit H [Candidatus Sumerlaeota bacterium]